MVYQSFAKHLLELLLLAGLFQSPAAYSQEALEPAPDFSLQSISGETYTLEQFQGSYVVLEWMNFRCRTVDDLYKNNVMPAMQKAFKEKGVVWLSIVSEADGKQGQVAAEKMIKQLEKRKANQEAVLLDVSGVVGQTYGVEVSPHVALVNPEGMLIYKGAFDNQPALKETPGTPALNYLSEALQQAMNGENIRFAITEAYGCPIRYDR